MMRRFLENILYPNRIKGVYQFLDKDRNPHIFIYTGKRVVELDYETEEKRTVATMKQINSAKPATEVANET